MLVSTAASEPAWTPAAPHWSNWRLALLVGGCRSFRCRCSLLPPASWRSGWRWRRVVAVAATAVVNAWGRHTGGLLVAPAMALLFVMNIFPLMWSFGLSFFAYRANRLAPPTFIGLGNYETVLTDPVVWDRLKVTALAVVLTVSPADARSASCWRCCSRSSFRAAAIC